MSCASSSPPGGGRSLLCLFCWLGRKVLSSCSPFSCSLAMPGSSSYLEDRRDQQPSELTFNLPLCLLVADKGRRTEMLSNLPQVTQQASGRARIRSRKYKSKTEFLNLSTFDVWGQAVLCCEGYPVHCSICSIPLSSRCQPHPQL